ncbi:excalibur calcium-binding domain-containing protein [Amycolatopsis sp. GM8]|uniref:excalibur calcium-binding domain-containing protein n=1 Tax=Amycolatopsis sp. GM8 TaxID=2896530 RepID=UPI001F157738|nr:excalibur calcium-binding domain-containing protein [Amycolatopsis sp. GM8]
MTSVAPVSRRPPRWLLIILGALAVLFLLGAVFGAKSPPTNTAAPAPVTTTTTTQPPADGYTVVTVVDAATVVVSDAQGARKTVQVPGVKAPLAATACFAPESIAGATTLLANQRLTLAADGGIVLANGTDYASAVIGAGYARAGVAPLQAAEAKARTAVLGLWAPPCNGDIDHPAFTPPPPPPSPVPVTTTTKPKPTTRVTTEEARPSTAERTTEPDVDSGVYYANCTEAKAAHAAPLHIGDPGYRPALDRDKDGVACE